MSKLETNNYELHEVTDFEIVGDYVLELEFDDGTEQIIDFEPILLGPIFGPLRELDIIQSDQIG
jgi:hypothetical protein